MIYFFLIILVLAISFFVVRIGGVALELTGMNNKQANFQSLSCFTGTGFTTKESELIVNHPGRRRIASLLMIAGNIVFVTMIGSVVNTLAASREINQHVSIVFLFKEIRVHYSLVMISEILLVVLSFYVFHIFFMRSSMWRFIQSKIRRRMSEMDAFSQIQLEEFMIGSHGCATIRILVDDASLLCGKTLRESNIRANYHAQVLAIEKGEHIIYNPTAEDTTEKGNYLILFGKMSEMNSGLSRLSKMKK